MTTSISPTPINTAAVAQDAGQSKNRPTGCIELGLFAPYNEVVQVLGNWDDWKPLDLTKGPDGWWRVNVELEDGDYLYKFRVKSTSFFAAGKMLDVYDPYALAVTDEADQKAKLRVRQGKRVDSEYCWKHDDKPLPDNRNLVIYELHVGDFSPPNADKNLKVGQFPNVIEKLDYLRELGINCLELMPVKEFPGKGWGYSLRSLFAVENSYGEPEDLCALVDEAHARGMRVIIDGVYNHAEADSPLGKIAYEYWYYKENPDGKELDWGPKFNYTHYDANLKIFPARKYVIESIQFWVRTFHIDGIRFDATRALKDFNIMREFADAAFETIGGIKPFITIAEHLAEDPAIVGRPEGGPMNAAWHENLTKQIQAVMTGKEVDGHQPFDLNALEQRLNPATNGYAQGDRLVNYLASHDSAHVMRFLGDHGKCFDEAAFRRVKLGFSLLLTSAGLPMIWMGDEFGFAAEKSLEPRPLDWSLLDNPSNRDLHEHVKLLNQIRHENDALVQDSFEVVLKDQERLLFAYKRWNAAGNVVLVVANLKDTPADGFIVDHAALGDGRWKDAIHGNEIHVEKGVLNDTLGASEVKIYIRQS